MPPFLRGKYLSAYQGRSGSGRLSHGDVARVSSPKGWTGAGGPVSKTARAPPPASLPMGMWLGHGRSVPTRETASLPKLPSLWTFPMAASQAHDGTIRTDILKSRPNPHIGPIPYGVKAIMVAKF